MTRQDPVSTEVAAAPAPAGAAGTSVVLSAPAAKPSASEAIDLNDARPRRWGWWLLLLGFGSFMLWAGFAPLDAGVPSTGTVVVSGNRKAVQPLAGGRISELLAKDGDRVTTGQPLVRLDDTQARAQLETSRAQWYSMLAVEARLNAEREGRDGVSYPAALRDAEREDPRAAAAIALQNQLFQSRRLGLEAELRVLRESISGLEIQVVSREELRRARLDQIRLLTAEVENQRSLARDGFLPRNRLSEQERMLSALLAASAEDIGNLGTTRQSIVETRARIAARQADYRREIESQLTDVQREVTALASRIDALLFEVDAAEIRSPSDGIVVGLSVHTVGGVVTPGASLMEVVPEHEPLRVDAQIATHLIDKVHPGLEVDLLFSAFNQATTPHVPGTVLNLSADALTDPKTEQLYYKAVIEVTPQGMEALRHHQIRAGMPAEVFIRTGERTLLNYLFKPLTDRIRGALTEP